MAWRIEYAERRRGLRAVVTGRASLDQARRIAGDIAGQAKAQAAKQVLIDVRRLMDRVGTLGALLVPASDVPDCRLAVLDVRENGAHYAFPERTLSMQGRGLRLFHDPAAAERWLDGR